MDDLWKRSSRAAADNVFGPQSETYSDVTLRFQESIFTIGPSAALLLVTPFYMTYYLGLPVATAEEPLVFAKLGTNGVLIVLQVVSAVLYNYPDDPMGISTASSVLACLAAVALAVFIHFEHRHAVESSPLPGLYIFVTLLLDAAKARSYFLRSATGLYSLGCVTALISVLKLVLLFLGELPRRYRVNKLSLGPETIHGFWGRTFLVWLNSTLLLGFRNILSIDDVAHLGPMFASARLAAIFEPVWIKRKPSSLKLLLATFFSLYWSFFAVVPARLVHMAFSFTEPFLLRRILQQAAQSSRDTKAENGLISAIALVRLGVTITRMWHKHMTNQLAIKTRGILVSQIFRKSIRIGRQEAKRSAAVSLMSTDVDSIVRTMDKIHETWASIVELPIGVYLLSTVIAQASFLVIFPITIATGLALEIGKRSRPATKVWNDFIEKRVAMTSKVLSQLRGIKMIAAETAVGCYVQRLRKTEVGYSKQARRLSVITNVALTMGYALTPVLVLAGGLFWSGFTTNFNAVDAFTTLSLIHLAARPMAAILNSWSQIGTFIACFERIQGYLSRDEHIDCREQVDGFLNTESPLEKEKALSYDISRFPLQLKDLSISSPDGRSLFSISTAFSRSSVTMVIGPTGSGKSTLLRALLGETNISEGSIYLLAQRMAYCDQEEWLRNVTIRSNIIGETDFDEEWYNKVITACLLRDIHEFPNGDMSLRGSRGSNLSGGQRQRVALARAIYSRAPIMLLDDVLSAVDSTTSSLILQQLVGVDGLLRRLGTTVIMTTHSLELLKSADRVLVIHTDGTATMQSPQSAIKKYEGRDFLDGDEAGSELVSDENSQDDSATRHYSPPAPKVQPSKQLRQTGDIKLYEYYFRSFSFKMLMVWLFVASLVIITEKGPDIYVRLWIDKDPNNKKLFIGYALLGVVNLIAIALYTWIYFIRLVPESAESLHMQLLTAVENATLSFITYTDSGSLLNRFSQDMSLVIQELPMAFFYFTYNLLGVLVTIGIIAAGAQYAATLIPFILTLLYGLQLYYLRTSRQMRLLDLESKSPMYTHLNECSEGIEHIRAFGWEQQYLQQGFDLLDRSQRPVYYLLCIQRWLSLVLDLTVTGIAVILVALAFNLGSTNQAALGLGLLKVMQIGSDLTFLVEWWASLETSLGAVSRVRTFEQETPREGADGEAHTTLTLPENWPQHGHIEVFNVNADYTVDGEDYRALHEITVDITAGTKVGLVGRTGSGKTSFLLTLLNFLKFTGSITIDGVDITTVPRHILRSRITTISQELMELPCSVRDNLMPREIVMATEDRINDAKLLDVLAKVGLRQLIENRGGLDAALCDIGLSAGEQQLFALARALVHHDQTNSKVIFVDEATSYIDYECEEKLQDITTEAFEDCTVLTIAHRYHTIQNTTLLELSSGRLVSYG